MSTKRFLTTIEVARLFEVSPNTVSRWAREGRLPCLTTPSGRRKFPSEAIEQLFGYTEQPGEEETRRPHGTPSIAGTKGEASATNEVLPMLAREETNVERS